MLFPGPNVSAVGLVGIPEFSSRWNIHRLHDNSILPPSQGSQKRWHSIPMIWNTARLYDEPKSSSHISSSSARAILVIFFRYDPHCSQLPIRALWIKPLPETRGAGVKGREIWGDGGKRECYDHGWSAHRSAKGTYHCSPIQGPRVYSGTIGTE